MKKGSLVATLLCVILPLLLVGGLALLLWAIQAPPASETVTTEAPATPTPPIPDTIDLGQGLTVTEMISAAGVFPEDGQNTVLSDMLCIKIVNGSDKTLQAAQIKLTVNGEDYYFTCTTLPAGASLYAYETNRKAAPQAVESLRSECLFASFFAAEPTVKGGELAISPADKGFTVKNLTEQDIDREICLYYKTIQNGVYMGGITYRVKLSGLKAGEEATVYADHASEAYTQVMFVEYGD